MYNSKRLVITLVLIIQDVRANGRFASCCAHLKYRWAQAACDANPDCKNPDCKYAYQIDCSNSSLLDSDFTTVPYSIKTTLRYRTRSTPPQSAGGQQSQASVGRHLWADLLA